MTTTSNLLKKECPKCKVTKNLTDFGKCKDSLDGLSYSCKECMLIKAKKYFKTIPGLITRIYASQKKSSKLRGHNPPEYSKEELKKWVLSRPNFKSLYDNYVSSGYKRRLVPSIDRLRNEEGYKFENIRLVSWEVNDKKEHLAVLNGENKSQIKPVIQFNFKGEKINEFHSISEANRQTGVNPSCIVKSCKGRDKRPTKFTWKYKVS